MKAEVRRDGTYREIDVETVVPGDILRVRAGDIVPADALIIECTAFTAGEAALTGEPYPVTKQASMPADADDSSNAVFRGSVAQTGEVVALVVALIVPFTPAGAWFGFVAPPAMVLATIAVLVGAYLVCAEGLRSFAVKTGPPRRHRRHHHHHGHA